MFRLQKSISKLLLRTKIHSNPIRKLHADPKRRRRPSNDNGDATHLRLHKSKGQHLLTNQRVLDAIVEKSAIRPTDTVLEIGPGTGNLTMKLLEVARNVVAVEIDGRMVEILRKRVAERGLEDRLLVIQEDFLKTELPRFDLVVANIPYNISSPIVAKLAYETTPFRSATLLLQKEFAARMTAKPGDAEFNRLAANVSLVAHVEHVIDVSKGEFFPRPKVDSSLVLLRPKGARDPALDLHEWRAFTKVCFGTKNKTLGAIFKGKKRVAELLGLSGFGVSNGDEGRSDSDSGLGCFRERIGRVLETGGFGDKRPSKMCNEEFICLLKLFNQEGIYFHDRSNSKARDGDKSEALDLAYGSYS